MQGQIGTIPTDGAVAHNRPSPYLIMRTCITVWIRGFRIPTMVYWRRVAMRMRASDYMSNFMRRCFDVIIVTEGISGQTAINLTD